MKSKKIIREVFDLIKIKRNQKRVSASIKNLKRRLCKNCEMCGCPAKEIHHIKGVAEYPELKNDINNMIIVCKECHKKIHEGKQ